MNPPCFVKVNVIPALLIGNLLPCSGVSPLAFVAISTFDLLCHLVSSAVLSSPGVIMIPILV